MAKIWKLAIKIYIRIIKHYTDIDPTINTWPRIFPVYKIDREQSEENFSKERLKIPKRYSEAVTFWELSKGLNIFYDKGPWYCASVIKA